MKMTMTDSKALIRNIEFLSQKLCQEIHGKRKDNITDVNIESIEYQIKNMENCLDRVRKIIKINSKYQDNYVLSAVIDD